MSAVSDSARLLPRFARGLVLLVLGSFTISHIWLGSEWVFIDGLNLVLHEMGHVLFSWAGDTMHFLGGTIGQLMWPAGLALFFGARQRQAFASGACVWWFAENLVNIARYMGDAQAQELPLVGGDVHDWNHLLGKWGLLGSARDIAGITRWAGTVLMLITLAFLIYQTVRPTQEQPRADISAEE